MSVLGWLGVAILAWLVAGFVPVLAWCAIVEISARRRRRRSAPLIDLTGVKPIPFDRERIGA